MDTHWAVTLNRGYVRSRIIQIRRARKGGVYVPGSEAFFLKRLKRDWDLYRWAMGQQELERRAARDTRTVLLMHDAIIAPMMRAAE